MKNLYSPDLAKSRYDVIIIGSGIGGLTSGVLLAKAGKKVLVLERHYVPGGFTHTFKRKKFEWDVGVHYVGQVNQEESMVRKAFDFVSDNKIKWAEMGEVYDQAIIDGDVYNFKTGRENQINQMINYFPQEEKAIRRYYDLLQKVGGASIWFFSERTMPDWLSKTMGHFMRKGFLKYSNRTTYEVIKELTDNEKLISVLCSQCGNYGLPPKKSSFGIHAVVTDHFIEGGNYPVDGAGSIAKSLIEVIEANGGTVAIKAPVKRVLVEKETAIGVEMENGDKLFSSTVISNTGIHNTYNHLLPDSQSTFVQQFKKMESSVSHFCLYLGLNASDETLKLPKHNIWLYTNYGFDEEYARSLSSPDEKSALAYISFPSAKDPNWPITHPNTSTIQVVASCPYDWVKEWENKQWMKRGEDYDEFKKRVEVMLLEKVLSVVPQIKNHIEVSELSTPLSTKHFSNYAKGEIYGLEHNERRFSIKQLRVTTHIKNFYLTGQDIVCVGVASSLFSGLITSVHILKHKSLGLLKAMMFPKKEQAM